MMEDLSSLTLSLYYTARCWPHNVPLPQEGSAIRLASTSQLLLPLSRRGFRLGLREREGVQSRALPIVELALPLAPLRIHKAARPVHSAHRATRVSRHHHQHRLPCRLVMGPGRKRDMHVPPQSHSRCSNRNRQDSPAALPLPQSQTSTMLPASACLPTHPFKPP